MLGIILWSRLLVLGSCYEWFGGPVMSGCGSCQKWFWGPVRSRFGVLLGVVLKSC